MNEAKQTKLLYCLSCGEEIPTYSVGVGSAVRADDSLRRMTEDCAPALNLNKGKDVAPPQLAERVKDNVPRLLKSARAA